MAEAYVLRTERNADLIADIEGGIKKEVSVGCAMGQARCSICGEPYGTCAHRKGAVYDGETCLAVLSEPLDAYEFSFVAVPAQRAAGVTKAGKEGYGMTLQDCVAKHGSPELSDALRRLSAEAELGRAWRKQLEDGLVALGLSLDLGASEQTLRKAAAALDDGQLQAWKAALDRPRRGALRRRAAAGKNAGKRQGRRSLSDLTRGFHWKRHVSEIRAFWAPWAEPEYERRIRQCNFSSGAGSGLHDDVSAGQRSGQHGVQDARQRYRRGLRGGQ